MMHWGPERLFPRVKCERRACKTVDTLFCALRPLQSDPLQYHNLSHAVKSRRAA